MSHYINPQYDDDQDPLEGRTALIQTQLSFHEITEQVCGVVENPKKIWWIFFLISLSMLGIFGISLAWLLWTGVGIWGHNNPVMWGWPIVNFVFWVGIGHAGTLISAILFLFRQKWRTSINRAAEAMTIFAVICALMFPTIHIGRVWVIYWALPIPNQMEMWPNFRSPLLWDVFAVSTYFTVSLLFWYVGLIPDIATLRDRAKSRIRQVAYGVFALGWRGSHRHWVNYESAYLLLAAMATPLVLSVHSIVSFDFAVSQLPGWHTTIFPPYFVAGAIFSGFGMVLTLLIPIRKWFKLEQIIQIKHLENMAKIILLTGSIVGYAYGLEFFIAWYSGNPLESFAFINRAFGDYSWAYFIMVSCNVITPQLVWFKSIRRSPMALFVLSIFVNIGMWFERFVIVVTSLHHDFLPSSWDYFTPTGWDFATLIGSFGLFFTLFCLFARYLPMVAMGEVKAIKMEASPHFVAGGGHGGAAARHGGSAARSSSSSISGRSGTVDSVHDSDDAGASTGSAKKVVVGGGLEAVSRAPKEDELDDGPTKVEAKPVSPRAPTVPEVVAPAKPEPDVPKVEVPKVEIPAPAEAPKPAAAPKPAEAPTPAVEKDEKPEAPKADDKLFVFEPPKPAASGDDKPGAGDTGDKE
ncbi:MAG TPA: NrfD/PsrC family molybdoenzyme membrane anchor subunit [Nannocystaceae bacterium]|nr:NrfD/PsrC family molybdoenzyme membrane anchor subunit [Nannocystaceae bacterium]